MVWSSWIVEALVQIVPFGRCWMFEKGVQTRFMLLTCITSPSVYVQCTSYIERNRYVCIWKRIESTHRIWPFLLCVVVCSELSLLKVIGLWLYIHTHISSLYHVIKTKKHFYMCIILILLFFFCSQTITKFHFCTLKQSRVTTTPNGFSTSYSITIYLYCPMTCEKNISK